MSNVISAARVSASQASWTRESGISDLAHTKAPAHRKVATRSPDSVDLSFERSRREIERSKEAREETGGFWTSLGSILLGPIVGTLIGNAIGASADDREEVKASDARRSRSWIDPND